ASRRTYSAQYKLRILAEYERRDRAGKRCDPPTRGCTRRSSLNGASSVTRAPCSPCTLAREATSVGRHVGGPKLPADCVLRPGLRPLVVDYASLRRGRPALFPGLPFLGHRAAPGQSDCDFHRHRSGGAKRARGAYDPLSRRVALVG